MSNGGGSAAGGGYDLQSRIIALVATHILAQEPLSWLRTEIYDVPLAVAAETGGAGDDIHIELANSELFYEVQSKRGLSAGERFDTTIERFLHSLAVSPELRCVLAIDTTSSNPLKEEFSRDLERLRDGRFDRLHQVTRKILHDTAAVSVTNQYILAKRIAVQVFDIERENSPGKQGAIFLLRQVLVDSMLAEAAWKILIADGLELIKRRGRRDAVAIKHLLEYHHIRVLVSSPAIMLDQYIQWMKDRTSAFVIPGFHLPLSIEDAWIELQVFYDQHETASRQEREESTSSYLKPQHLASRENRRNVREFVTLATEVRRCSVVIGGPGAGKSTLCQRVAYDLTAGGARVLWIHLPLVVNHILHGKTIDEAILAVATEGFGMQAKKLYDLLDHPDYLLADGFDECGQYRCYIATQIKAWASSRPATRIVVTTRPLGYERSFFADWAHADLLALDERRIEEHARRIIATVEQRPERVAEKASQFHMQTDHNKIASMAARNPLLLGFLLQLFLADVPFAQHRVRLYDQMLELWRITPSLDRVFEVPQIDPVLAHRSLDIIGWCLQNASPEVGRLSERELTRLLAEHLAKDKGNTPQLHTSEAACCITFWYEKGVLERYYEKQGAIYTFVHVVLGEFAASRYVANLSEAELQLWLDAAYRNPHQRELILFASGLGEADVIVEHLLSLVENDPSETAVVLAASALAEAANCSPALIAMVAEYITVRLASPIPLIAYEAAESAVSLAMQMPKVIIPLLTPLFYHTQAWTRLAALRVALAGHDERINSDVLEACLDEQPVACELIPLTYEQSMKNGTRDTSQKSPFWYEAIAVCAKALASARPDTQTVECLMRLSERFFRLRIPGVVCSEEFYELSTTLLGCVGDLGDQGMLQALAELSQEVGAHLIRLSDAFRTADQTILESILRVVEPVELNQTGPRSLSELIKLLSALRIPEAISFDALFCTEPMDQAAIDVVFSGTVAALRLDHAELAKDARYILREACTSQMESNRCCKMSLMSLPTILVKPEWKNTNIDALFIEDLVRAVSHPSLMIATGAAKMLIARADDHIVRESARHIVINGSDQALEIVAPLAYLLWGDDAYFLLLDRLEGEFSSGCQWLFRALPFLAKDHADPRMSLVLQRGLFANDPHIAIAAVDAIESLDVDSMMKMLLPLREALSHWVMRGDYCSMCQRYVQEPCSGCGLPSVCVRAALIRILASLNAFNLQDLLDFCLDGHPSVVSIAKEKTAKMLSSQPEHLQRVIDSIAQGHHSPRVLEAILLLPPELLAAVQMEFLQLLHAQAGVLRKMIVEAVTTAEWLPKEKKLEIAQNALADQDYRVRDQAILTLRTLV